MFSFYKIYIYDKDIFGRFWYIGCFWNFIMFVKILVKDIIIFDLVNVN